MDILKLTSIRISKNSLDAAKKIGRDYGYFQTSSVLRVAIWVGLKCITPGRLSRLAHMMWEEEERGKHFALEDVLRAAEVCD